MSISRERPPSLAVPGHGVRPRSPAEALEPTRAPSRPKGARVRGGNRPVSGVVRFTSGVMTGALMVMATVAGCVFMLNYSYDAAGPLTNARAISIRSGEGRIQIAQKLEESGVVGSRQLFVINHFGRNFVRWFNGEPWLDLKAGEYEFAAGATMRSVLETISKGQIVVYKVTVPEGLTSQQIVDRVVKAEDLAGEIPAVPAEGSLLPDTYLFSKGGTRQDVMQRMTDAHASVLTELWEKRAPDLPVASKEEAVILASIVEKETGVRSERARVAGVFANRLRKGMRLQSDPTIIYGIVGGQGSLGRPLYRTDIKKKTPYNTYQIKGLPPTPICNPGREAIAAVLNPEVSDDLYFVADGTGGHTFSKTLKDHNIAVANWRKIEKAAREKAKVAAATEAAAASSAVVVSAENSQALPVSSESSSQGHAPSDQVNVVNGKTPEVTALNVSDAGTTGSVRIVGQRDDTPSDAEVVVPLPVRKPK